jgi:DNA-binding beta-propeller fold protein YncE
VEKDMLYVADSESSSIRFIDLKKHYTGTIVGKGLFEFGYEDGALNNAKLQHPIGIDSNNRNIYVADTYNNAIRFIDIEKREMKTIIGTKDVHSVCRFDDPHCDILGLYEPSDVKIHVNKLYIADTNNHLIRSFDMRTSLLKTVKLKFPI